MPFFPVTLPYCCSPTSKSHICTKISVSRSASVRIQTKSVLNQVSQSDSLFWDFCNWNNESVYGMVSSREFGLWFLDFSSFLKISPALESYYSLLYLHYLIIVFWFYLRKKVCFVTLNQNILLLYHSFLFIEASYLKIR